MFKYKRAAYIFIYRLPTSQWNIYNKEGRCEIILFPLKFFLKQNTTLLLSKTHYILTCIRGGAAVVANPARAAPQPPGNTPQSFCIRGGSAVVANPASAAPQPFSNTPQSVGIWGGGAGVNGSTRA